MNFESPKTYRVWIIAVSMLSLGLFLTSCGTQQPPTSEPDLSAASAALEIGGLGAGGTPSTLYIPASDVAVMAAFTETVMTYLGEAYSQTDHLAYALLYDGGENWRLYYAQPPTGIITPTQTQMHLVQSADAHQSLFASSPYYSVSETLPLSDTDEAGSAILLNDGIELIADELGEAVPAGRVLSRPTAFLLLSDGDADQPQYALISFGPIQPDGTLDPPAPGGPHDLRGYCLRVIRPPWWCRYFR
jgi:hypothetical protein